MQDKPSFVFDCEHPTPILDALAAKMAQALASSPPMTIRELMKATGSKQGSVHHVLTRPCPRHGGRFECIGERSRYPARGAPAKLYRLKDSA